MTTTSTASAAATPAILPTPQQLAVLSRTALPLVDQEYDIPEYKTYVDYMIQEEMRSYQPPADAALSLADRFTSLWSDEEVDACLARIDQRKLLTEPKLDPQHYQTISAPTGRQVFKSLVLPEALSWFVDDLDEECRLNQRRAHAAVWSFGKHIRRCRIYAIDTHRR